MKRRTRRINHTQRTRIDRARVQLRVVSNDDTVMLSVSVDLDGLNIEGDAKVFLDVSRKAQSERFALGTVERLATLENVATRFGDAVGLRYDVVVVGAEDALLLAAARRVRPENADAQESLLAIRPSGELDELAWRLDMYDGQPVIEVNDRILNWRDLADGSMFQSLVLPQVVGQILRHIAAQGGVDESDDDEPLVPWCAFFRELGVEVDLISSSEPSDVVDGLVEEAIAAFASRHGFASQIVAAGDWSTP